MNIRNEKEIDYSKWKKVIFVAQIVFFIMIFLSEAIGNYILYATRSQGYNPDTIVERLLRYLILTSGINLAAIIIGQLVVNKTNNIKLQKYTLIITTEIMCTNIATAHYQFADTFGIFVIPLAICILFEDKTLCNVAFILDMIGASAAIIDRGKDSEFNQNIGPEAIIAYMLIVSIYLFSRIVLDTLYSRRLSLEDALVKAERSKYLDEVEKLSIQTLSTLAQALDAKDKYTNGHSYRVSQYSVKLAKELGYHKDELRVLEQEALLHDIGKIGIPDSILNKPGQLSDIEFNVMKTHTTVGSEILQDMIILPDAFQVADYHHERFDGKGYPKGLNGKETPEHARIVCIADAYDAMSSNRIYRKALSKEQIREQLIKGRGTQFDPEFLDVFIKLFDEGKMNIPTNNTININNDNNISFDTINIKENLDSFITQINYNEQHPVNTISEVANAPLEINKEDFNKIHEYVKSFEKRYQYNFEMVMLSINVKDGEKINPKEEAEIAEAMELAIKKNIRSVDIYTQYSSRKHLIVLSNTSKENIDSIVQRSFLDFYKLFDTKKITLSYDIKI